MKKMKIVQLLVLVAAACLAHAGGEVLYENNFESADVGAVPQEFMVTDGAFSVKAEGGNKFLELAEAPLDAFGVLFGPTQPAEVCVSARIFGTARGKRYPTFGVGLNGVGGYKLQVSPGKGKLELYKGEEVVAFIPYAWDSGTWFCFKLQATKTAAGVVKVEGKAWPEGAAEPKEWNLKFEDKTPPSAGRAAIWGSPFARTPIRYDNLKVTSVK